MMENEGNPPNVVTHRIPQIEIYQVTDDELARIEEGYSTVGQDYTFFLTSLSVGITSFISLAAGNYDSDMALLVKVISGICVVVSAYTGFKWFRQKGIGPNVIRNVRNRRIDPET